MRAIALFGFQRRRRRRRSRPTRRRPWFLAAPAKPQPAAAKTGRLPKRAKVARVLIPADPAVTVGAATKPRRRQGAALRRPRRHTDGGGKAGNWVTSGRCSGSRS